MNLAISRPLLDRLRQEAQAAEDMEICGLLVGKPGQIDAVVPLRNWDPEPKHGFALDPAEHVAAARHARVARMTVLGHYHSHPSGNAVPSMADAAQAHEEGVYWLIVAGREARLWISRRGGPVLRAFEPVELMLL
jgi:proteasome lid subunit RPN8/RPN11